MLVFCVCSCGVGAAMVTVNWAQATVSIVVCLFLCISHRNFDRITSTLQALCQPLCVRGSLLFFFVLAFCALD